MNINNGSFKTIMVFFVFLVAFTQPNGIFLLFPAIKYILGLISIIILFAGYSSLRKAGIRIDLLFWLAFIAIAGLQLVDAVDFGGGIYIWISLALKVFVVAAMMFHINTAEKFNYLLYLLGVAGAIFAVHGILQFLLIFFNLIESKGVIIFDEYQFENYGIFGITANSFFIGNAFITRVSSFFIEPGYYAQFMELCFLSLLAVKDIFFKRWMQVFIIMSYLTVALLSFSPPFILIVASGLCFYGFVRRDRLSLFALSAVFVILLSFVAYNYDYINEILTNPYIGKAGSADKRWDDYKDTINIIRRNTSLIDAIGINQIKYYDYGNAVRANNLFLDIMLMTGIGGVLVFVAYLCMYFWRLLTNYNKDTVRYYPVFAGLFAHSLLVPSIYNYYFWVALVIPIIAVKLYGNGDRFSQSPHLST